MKLLKILILSLLLCACSSEKELTQYEHYTLNAGFDTFISYKFYAESKEEFDNWVEETKAPLIKKLGYLSTLSWKEKRDGTMPIVNLANRVLKEDELGFV